MKTELLSPAGSLEAAYSAFYYGADAIYLGLKRFSARTNAINFSRGELDEITSYAHSIGKKVYVAFNTIVKENEMDLALETLQTCANCHVDAIIVQDLGIARIIKKSFPTLALHASTQMAVHNLQGAKALYDMGFERAVLARELSLSQIQYIKDNCPIEIEVFIHGALCYSLSGLCNFSALSNNRSANRGECVYACRGAYKMGDTTIHPFSMKDLALEKEVLNLKGISLKIEGRKKTALYVAAVTDYYRRILDNKPTPTSLTDNIKLIFARPWTPLHFTHKNKDVFEKSHMGPQGLQIGVVQSVKNNQITFKTSPPFEKRDGIQININATSKPLGFSVQHISINGKHSFKAGANQTITITLPDNAPYIPQGSPIFLASSQAVKRAYPFDTPKAGLYKNKALIDVKITITPTNITATHTDFSATITDTFTPANNIEKMQSALHTAFDKTGDYAFTLNNLQIENPNTLFVPMSILNELRRQLYDKIVIETKNAALPPVLKQNQQKQAPKWQIKVDNLSLLPDIDLSRIDSVIIPLTPNLSPDMVPDIKKDIILSLPAVHFNVEIFKNVIDRFIKAGFTHFMANNIAHLHILPKNATITFGENMHMLNTQALSHANNLGATAITYSIEDTKENIAKLLDYDINSTLIIYQDIPLFISKNCIRPTSCDMCDKKPVSIPLIGKSD